MNKLNFLYHLLIIVTISGFSQEIPRDTIYGPIRQIREKVVFLTEKQNPQMLYYNDYGHSGFMGPKATVSKFRSMWFASEMSYFINYVRYFDNQRKVTREIWYDKKDKFLKFYRYVYDDKERIISEIDSTGYSYGTENYYYTNTGIQNIIYQDAGAEFYSHHLKKIVDGKLITMKRYDEYGSVDEYNYFYSPTGKLEYRIYKNPDTWKPLDDKSWSYGPNDSVGSTYKDQIYEYDETDRLVSIRNYSLYADPEHQNPIETGRTEYRYSGQNISLVKEIPRNGTPTFYHFKFDEHNRLIEKICCSENIRDAMQIRRYNYKDDIIVGLDYTKRGFNSAEKEQFNVTYDYKFDKYNNWTEIIKSIDGVSLYKWIRKIKYY